MMTSAYLRTIGLKAHFHFWLRAQCAFARREQQQHGEKRAGRPARPDDRVPVLIGERMIRTKNDDFLF